MEIQNLQEESCLFFSLKKKDVTPGVPGNISIYSTRHSTNVLIHKYILKKAEESIGGGGGGGVRTPVAAARYKNRPRRFF